MCGSSQKIIDVRISAFIYLQEIAKVVNFARLKLTFICQSSYIYALKIFEFQIKLIRAVYMGELRKNTTSNRTITKKPRYLWQNRDCWYKKKSFMK